MTLWMITLFLLAITAAAMAGVAAVWASANSSRREAEAQAAAHRQEIQNMVTAQSQAVASHLGQLAQSITLQLGQMSQQVQTGMASSGELASGAQKAVSEQLKASTDMLGTIRQQLGEVQQAGQELSGAARQIENVLGGAKTRGTLGEVALDRMLSDSLPVAAYAMQHRFASGEAVDAVVRLNDKLLPIDSKFPLDDYRRLVDTGEEARGGFSKAVRFHADAIAKKYVLPGEGTLDIALMFIPSEGVYYELLKTLDAKGNSLDEYCRAKGVVAVSPSTLFGYLRIIALGLRGMQVEENAKRLLASLTGLKKQMENFTELYQRIGTHLRNAQQCYSEADRKLERARITVEELAQCAPATKDVESAATDLSEAGLVRSGRSAL
jgi:DNA recombination protein RmuC